MFEFNLRLLDVQQTYVENMRCTCGLCVLLRIYCVRAVCLHVCGIGFDIMIFCVRVCGYVYTLSTSMQLLARRQEIGSFTLWKCVKVRGIIACDCSKDKYFVVSRSVQ